MGCHFLHQGIFLTQGSNLYLLHLLHPPALEGGFFTTELPGKPNWSVDLSDWRVLKSSDLSWYLLPRAHVHFIFTDKESEVAWCVQTNGKSAVEIRYFQIWLREVERNQNLEPIPPLFCNVNSDKLHWNFQNLLFFFPTCKRKSKNKTTTTSPGLGWEKIEQHRWAYSWYRNVFLSTHLCQSL